MINCELVNVEVSVKNQLETSNKQLHIYKLSVKMKFWAEDLNTERH